MGVLMVMLHNYFPHASVNLSRQGPVSLLKCSRNRHNPTLKSHASFTAFITMDGRNEALHLLRELTGRHYIQYTARGNAAIRQALSIARDQGRKRLLIPDQGGWITYPQIGKELGYEVSTIKTEDGIIAPDDVKGDDKTVLLLNTMPAYAFRLDVQGIAKKAAGQGILFINDASATIGTPDATHGDLIIGSCNRWKPLPLQKGGFIAADAELPGEEEPGLDYERLAELLRTLPERCEAIRAKARALKEGLRDHHVLRPEHEGYNVIVAYATEEEKQTLINDARTIDPAIEHTECPRYIRVERTAISLENKRHFDDT